LVPGTLCFFCGHISSAYAQSRYFIDGVAIGGVSGGPAFYHSEDDDGIRIVGSITAYTPAKSGGESLPGLMVADEVGWAATKDEP
jgi:hypothetical protein